MELAERAERPCHLVTPQGVLFPIRKMKDMVPHSICHHVEDKGTKTETIQETHDMSPSESQISANVID